MRRASTRMKSLRSLIAIGGAAAMAFGLAQTTGTMANPTDAVNSTGAQVATGNFYPTPLTASIGCSTSGSVTSQRGNPYWSAVPGATGYKVELMNRSNNTVKDTKTFTSTQLQWSSVSDSDRTGLYIRVYTINGPMTSSGYTTGAGMSFKDWVSGRTACEGSSSTSKPNQVWENTNTWDPTTPAPNGSNPLSRMQAEAMVPNEPDALEANTTQAPSTSETVKSTTSTEPTSTTETTTTTAPSTTTPAPTTPETTSPETTPSADPKPVLTDTVESGGLTGGWTAGGNKVAVVDADGNELASGRVESGSTLHWYNGQLWIVGATEVFRIMESPQDGTWKFYKDSGQNMPDFG
ncbi:hypothetical protein O4214_15845 [Rhodococcus erythropolis]|uniref:hypothetical protein n=1 Tax=Rhodococcus erythropolis TaxID=1833 RepID=UPI001E6125B6|nr:MULTISPECIES: hypothetical protein [Rhodococcus erythropolis group]MCD2106661.1 hypothetical protein [Rhodococcus qingshengii]MCZ4525460.1 hypothetical protein [Rhodococcus erythropolis]